MTLKDTMNHLGSQKEPFFFCINYDMTQWDVIKLSKLPNDIQFKLNTQNYTNHNTTLYTEHISKKKYQYQFNKIQKEILEGNSYLANLTTSTKINSNKSLLELYNYANSKFKLFYKNQFICFSPERFVECIDNKIYTYPMKGTIDATIPNAKELILNNAKELAEHTMIVDLLRNDLSIVSSNVKVENFRYCENIKAGDKELIQVSSKISGILENRWQNNIGNIITSLLPAGSITGTPKKRTIEILNTIEDHNRDFFTGIFGVFDGYNLDSAVMIRFIQQDKDKNMIYKSGGGITCDSDMELEYNEMIDKVYIP